MKKCTLYSLVFFVIVSVFQSLHAQESKRFDLSLEYSPNFSIVTDEFIYENFKLSHNALLRIAYKGDLNFEPTIGIGFMNTGNLAETNHGGHLGIESFKEIRNYNYMFIPVGAKINRGKFYFLPEIGLGVYLFNRKKQIITFTSGETKKETFVEIPIHGKFNRIFIPLSMTLGYRFSGVAKTFSTGMKSYYGLTRVVKGAPRSGHHFGIGLFLAYDF